MILLDEIIARLNEQFAGEGFRDDQERSWVEALVAAMRADAELVEQAEVNSEAQFLASPTLQDAVMLAVAETDVAHSRMTALFNVKGGVEKTVIELLGRLLYLELRQDEPTAAPGSSGDIREGVKGRDLTWPDSGNGVALQLAQQEQSTNGFAP